MVIGGLRAEPEGTNRWRVYVSYRGNVSYVTYGTWEEVEPMLVELDVKWKNPEVRRGLGFQRQQFKKIPW